MKPVCPQGAALRVNTGEPRSGGAPTNASLGGTEGEFYRQDLQTDRWRFTRSTAPLTAIAGCAKQAVAQRGQWADAVDLGGEPACRSSVMMQSPPRCIS